MVVFWFVNFLFHLAIWYLLHSNLASHGRTSLAGSGLIGMDFRVGSDCNAAFRIRVLVTRIVVDIRSVHAVKRTVSCNPPFLIELISSGFDVSFLKHARLGHPFFFAAGFLTGRLALDAPDSYLPWRRLLVARMGIHEARSTGTQILMFMLLITAAFFIFDAFNGFTIWIPVLSVLIPLLMFMGGDPRIPVLMDGDRPLSEDHHRRLGIVLFVAILFAIPAQFPVEPVDRWDADATYSITVDEFAELADAWNASIAIELTNPSMQDREYNVSGGIVGNALWSSNFSCGNDHCEGVLQPGESLEFVFTMQHENVSHQPTSIDYELSIVFDGSDAFVESGTIHPLLNASVAAEWHYVRADDGVLACVDVYIEEDFTTNISFPDLGDEWLPFVWFDGQAGLTQALSSEDQLFA